MTLYLIGAMLVFAIVLIVYALWPKKADEGEAIKRRMAGRTPQSKVARVRQQAKESVAKRVMNKVAPIAVRPVMVTSAEQMSKLRIKLTSAGFRGERSPVTFLASKTIVAVGLGLAATAYCWAKGMPLPDGGRSRHARYGFRLPRAQPLAQHGHLEARGADSTGTARHPRHAGHFRRIGLGLDAAFQRVGEEMHKVHPTIAEELQIVTLEAQMGIPRAEALDNFATRSGVDEARSLVGIVNQAERFGTSIAHALRRQSKALRIKRRQAAEEKAQKTTVKLMAPLIFCIFPAILVVLAGPAGLKMVEMFGNR